jgi:hydroxyacylglutathione hydrolase
MTRRKYLFPDYRVLELNYQAGRRLGANVYVVDGGSEYILIDIGYADTVEEIADLLLRMDYSLSACKMIIASHADADHAQGLARASALFKTRVAAHSESVPALETGDPILTFAQIKAQGIALEMPPCRVDIRLQDGDEIEVGELRLKVWHTPGHTPGQIALQLDRLLFSGDNLFADGCVGVIDAHHGSNIPDFIRSLERIRDADVEYLLPSHGPVFPHDRAMIQRTIDPPATLPVHGRFRHLCGLLATARPVGAGHPRWQTTYSAKKHPQRNHRASPAIEVRPRHGPWPKSAGAVVAKPPALSATRALTKRNHLRTSNIWPRRGITVCTDSRMRSPCQRTHSPVARLTQDYSLHRQ